MRLLLLSNSTNPGEEYLSWPKEEIKAFIGNYPAKALFIPYAAVTLTYYEYEAKVQARFSELGYSIESIHHAWNPIQAVEQAEIIVVGGGNTWQLTKLMHEYKLMTPIREKVQNGAPYIGWSAGSNVACPTLRTTNDMPIVDPSDFGTLNLVPFQINPHYTDAHPPGHGGETREDRINEFITLNPDMYVVGLREATLLRVEDNNLSLVGDKKVRLFKKGTAPSELDRKADLSFLLDRGPSIPFC